MILRTASYVVTDMRQLSHNKGMQQTCTKGMYEQAYLVGKKDIRKILQDIFCS